MYLDSCRDMASGIYLDFKATWLYIELRAISRQSLDVRCAHTASPRFITFIRFNDKKSLFVLSSLTGVIVRCVNAGCRIRY